MIEPIIATASLGLIIGIVFSRKVPRFIIREVLRDPLHLASFIVKNNGNGTKDVTIMRKNKSPRTLVI